MDDLSENERLIYDLIIKEPNKEIKPTDLVKKTKMSPRKVRAILKKLEERNLVSKRPNFMDLRSHLYYPTTKQLSQQEA